MNVVHLIGRLGRDPKKGSINNDVSVAQLTVATSEKWKDRNGEKREKTEWHRVVAWNHTADFAAKYLRKGRLVHVTGKLETRKWQDKNGDDRYTTEIKASVIKALDKMDDDQSQPEQSRDNRYQNQTQHQSQQDYGLNDEIPF